MITLFFCPKPFTGEVNIIQRNAIKSWQALQPKPEIILIGNEPGAEEACREFDILHIKEVEHNEYGTPLVSSLFKKAGECASYGILCYINSDIMLTDSFMDAVKIVKDWKDRFLMVGKRLDVQINEEFNPSVSGWIEKIKSHSRETGRMHACTGVDYFIFKKGMFLNIPDFSIGRPCWDGWLVYQARRSKIPVIDATAKILAIHQDHRYDNNRFDKNGKWNWRERQIGRNLALSNGLIRDISNATHRIKNNRICRRKVYLWLEPGMIFLANIIKTIKLYFKATKEK